MSAGVAEHVVLVLFNRIYRLKQMWLFLNLLYVNVQSLVKFYIVILYTILGEGVLYSTLFTT